MYFRVNINIAWLFFVWRRIEGVVGAKLTCSRLPSAHLWTQHNDTCYLVRNVKKYTYDKGRKYCHDQCSDYAHPNTNEENDWIMDKFEELYSGTPDKLWLGCNNTSGQWVCHGDTATNKYRNWRDGEPTNSNVLAYMWKSEYGGKWGYGGLDSAAKWTMCEAPAKPLHPLNVRCNAVAIPSGKCPIPFNTTKVANPMQCCLACAKQCNCRSFSLTGNINCQMNLGKINDPVTSLQNQQCEYYEYEMQH